MALWGGFVSDKGLDGGNGLDGICERGRAGLRQGEEIHAQC